MIRSLVQAQRELSDVAPRIEGAIRNALQRFTSEHAQQRRDYSRRSQASIVHDLMVSETRKVLDGWPGVVCMTTRGTFVVIVRQTYIIKLKKMGRRLQTANIPTQTLLDFMYQRPMQLTLTQVPTETHMICGYQPRGDELLSSTIWAMCPIGGRVSWSWTLEAAPVAEMVRLQPAEKQLDDAGTLYNVKPDSDAKSTATGNDDET